MVSTVIQCLLIALIASSCFRDLEGYITKKSLAEWESGQGLHLSEKEQMRIRSMAQSIAKGLRSRPKTNAQVRAEQDEQTRNIKAEINGQYLNLAKIQQLNNKVDQMHRNNLKMQRHRILRARRRRMNRLRRKLRL